LFGLALAGIFLVVVLVFILRGIDAVTNGKAKELAEQESRAERQRLFNLQARTQGWGPQQPRRPMTPGPGAHQPFERPTQPPPPPAGASSSATAPGTLPRRSDQVRHAPLPRRGAR